MNGFIFAVFCSGFLFVHLQDFWQINSTWMYKHEFSSKKMARPRYRVRIQWYGVNTLIHEPLRQIWMIRWTLAANSHIPWDLWMDFWKQNMLGNKNRLEVPVFFLLGSSLVELCFLWGGEKERGIGCWDPNKFKWDNCLSFLHCQEKSLNILDRNDCCFGHSVSHFVCSKCPINILWSITRQLWKVRQEWTSTFNTPEMQKKSDIVRAFHHWALQSKSHFYSNHFFMTLYEYLSQTRIIFTSSSPPNQNHPHPLPSKNKCFFKSQSLALSLCGFDQSFQTFHHSRISLIKVLSYQTCQQRRRDWGEQVERMECSFLRHTHLKTKMETPNWWFIDALIYSRYCVNILPYINILDSWMYDMSSIHVNAIMIFTWV